MSKKAATKLVKNMAQVMGLGDALKDHIMNLYYSMNIFLFIAISLAVNQSSGLYQNCEIFMAQ